MLQDCLGIFPGVTSSSIGGEVLEAEAGDGNHIGISENDFKIFEQTRSVEMADKLVKSQEMAFKAVQGY